MSRPRCAACCRPLSHCLCPLIPSLPSRTRLLLLQHEREAVHALNTARLAALGLQQARLEVGEQFAELDSWLAEPDVEPVLLFPGEDALPIGEWRAGQGRQTLLVVPDGTWRKARKLLHVNPQLARLPRVRLPEGLESRYRLRKAPMAGALSTLEAIVEVLNCWEAPADFSALLRPFEALIEGQIAAMGEETYRRNHDG
ncbi:DTW domain-containing protein [Pseudomonas sp. HAR-UPW-AIA-41]|uniref:tRNA-uridine aminocarboxypropyltransferase n=1 Tax=Pseudomonas sp. HAR-UPW-AIA-41 TaxID=1985301 RepID=UPI000BB395D8|nr:DTW domain-containing protein [Pseudomonas sp. HAR-UPW-AIA-41]PAV48813.1 DTW domain-containing protein [Pseudomonas sp. HAR-UPW-AIA-41]